ncbi:RraA family protein [Paraburkholderia strydomiana]
MNLQPMLEISERLGTLGSADAADALMSLGVSRVVMNELQMFGSLKGSIVGRARTLRFLPEREDIECAPGGRVNRQLYETVEPGDVLVVDALGAQYAALGDMMYSRLAYRRVGAIVVDGAVRDVEAAATKDFPVFARGKSARPYFGAMQPWEADVAVQCSGVLVCSRDWIVADSDGVVVVPPNLALDVVEMAERKRVADQFSRALLHAGFPLADAYPLPGYMSPYLTRYLDEQVLPTQEEVAAARE